MVFFVRTGAKYFCPGFLSRDMEQPAARAVFGSVRPPLGSGKQEDVGPSGAASRRPGGGADAPPAPGIGEETYGPKSRTDDAPVAVSVFGSVRAPLGSASGAAECAPGASVFSSVKPVFGSLNPPLGSAGGQAIQHFRGSVDGVGAAGSTALSGSRSAFGFGSVHPPLGGGSGNDSLDAPRVREGRESPIRRGRSAVGGLAGLARELSGTMDAPAAYVSGSVLEPLGSSGGAAAREGAGFGFGFASVRPPLGIGNHGGAPVEAASSPTASPASEVGFTAVRAPISTSGYGNARLDAARPPHIDTPGHSERPGSKVGVCTCVCVFVHTHIHVYTYTHTIHTHTHTHTIHTHTTSHTLSANPSLLTPTLNLYSSKVICSI